MVRGALVLGSVAVSVALFSGCMAHVQQARAVVMQAQALQAPAGGAPAAVDVGVPVANDVPAVVVAHPAAGVVANQIGARFGLPMGAIMGAASATAGTAAVAVQPPTAAPQGPRVSQQPGDTITVAPNREIDARQFALLRERAIEIARVSACAQDGGRALGRFAHGDAQMVNINYGLVPAARMRNHPQGECVRIDRVSFTREAANAVAVRVRYVSEQSGEGAIGVYHLRTEDGDWRLMRRGFQ